MAEKKCPITAQMLADLKEGEGAAKCTWTPDSKASCPHASTPYQRPSGKPKILASILDHIGNTPLVRINNITKAEGITCELLAKCEFFNAGGSVKDRIGKRMVLDAEASGRIRPGDTLIEPTSGNTGIGMALTAALRGFRMIITLPEKMSNEKVFVLKALGAEIIRTPTEAAFDSPESHIGVANRLNREIPNSHILDQYSNPSNPLAHYEGTAEEILDACDDKIDAIVISAGTGGTISGIARKFRERVPNCEIIGVDPHGSILALPESLNKAEFSYKVEGIGYDFIPAVLERKLIDSWIKTMDKESFIMSRRLIKEEGLLCGGSCGSAMAAAVQVCKRFGPGQRVVVLFADSVRNYMSKFLSDDWMIESGFMDDPEEDKCQEWWHGKTVSELKLTSPVTCSPTVTCQGVIDILASQGYDQIPVIDNNGAVVGMATNGNLLSKIASGRVGANDPVMDAVFKQFASVTNSTSLLRLSKIFDRHHYAVVTATQKRFEGSGNVTESQIVVGVASRIDLVQYILKNKPVETEKTSA